MKFLVFTIVLVSLGALVLTQGRQNIIQLGSRKPSDVLIGSYVAIKSAKKSWFSSKTQTVTYQYPARGQVGSNISAIYFYEAPNGGGNPKLLSGGISRNFTTIRLTSKPGKGLNVTVELYGPMNKWNRW